jgi:hypothetical protein
MPVYTHTGSKEMKGRKEGRKERRKGKGGGEGRIAFSLLSFMRS